MASKVGMCNAALNKIGANEILSLTEDSPEARKCNARFQDLLDALLQAHPWNFAVERVTLTASATAPNHEYSYKFLLPTRPYCLQVLRVYGDYEYKIEGRYLYTNYSDINIKYIKRVSDVNELSPLFREAFSLYLGSELAFPIAGSNALKQSLAAEFTALLKLARGRDSQEDTSDQFLDGTWITNRGIARSRYVVS